MEKSRVIKYRWIVLCAMVSCGLLAATIAFGIPHREGITPTLAFIPFAMFLVALIPVSVARIVAHKWFAPIASTWGCSSIVAIHFAGTRLMGLGHQCDNVALTTSIAGFCLINVIWAIGELRRWRRTAETNRAGQKNAAALAATV
jgi:hypothetical protein